MTGQQEPRSHQRIQSRNQKCKYSLFPTPSLREKSRTTGSREALLLDSDTTLLNEGISPRRMRPKTRTYAGPSSSPTTNGAKGYLSPRVASPPQTCVMRKTFRQRIRERGQAPPKDVQLRKECERLPSPAIDPDPPGEERLQLANGNKRFGPAKQIMKGILKVVSGTTLRTRRTAEHEDGIDAIDWAYMSGGGLNERKCYPAKQEPAVMENAQWEITGKP